MENEQCNVSSEEASGKGSSERSSERSHEKTIARTRGAVNERVWE